MRPGEGTTSRSWDLRWRGPRRWKLAALSLPPGQRPPHGSAPAAARLPDPGQDSGRHFSSCAGLPAKEGQGDLATVALRLERQSPGSVSLWPLSLSPYDLRLFLGILLTGHLKNVHCDSVYQILDGYSWQEASQKNKFYASIMVLTLSAYKLMELSVLFFPALPTRFLPSFLSVLIA